MSAIVDKTQQRRAQRVKQLFSRYQRNRDLISVGAYSPGHDPQLDQAVQRYPHIEHFLQQGMEECADLQSTTAAMAALLPDVAPAGVKP